MILIFYNTFVKYTTISIIQNISKVQEFLYKIDQVVIKNLCLILKILEKIESFSLKIKISFTQCQYCLSKIVTMTSISFKAFSSLGRFARMSPIVSSV